MDWKPKSEVNYEYFKYQTLAALETLLQRTQWINNSQKFWKAEITANDEGIFIFQWSV